MERVKDAAGVWCVLRENRDKVLIRDGDCYAVIWVWEMALLCGKLLWQSTPSRSRPEAPMDTIAEAIRAAGNVLLTPVTLADIPGAADWRRALLVGSRRSPSSCRRFGRF